MNHVRISPATNLSASGWVPKAMLSNLEGNVGYMNCYPDSDGHSSTNTTVWDDLPFGRFPNKRDISEKVSVS